MALRLITLTAAFSFLAAQDFNPLLFSEECCAKKTVGGETYNQEAGDTTGYPQCEGQCVYKKEGDSGSQFCFKKGPGPDAKEAACTESTLDSEYVKVQRNNNELHFVTKMGTHHCTLDNIPSDEISVNITCFKTEDTFDAVEEEKASLFSSKSPTGKSEWMALFSPSHFIQCDFIESLGLSCISARHQGLPSGGDGTSVSPAALDEHGEDGGCGSPSSSRDILAQYGGYNVVFVLGAKPINGSGLNDTLMKCSERCDNCSYCKFWTLSYDTNVTDTRVHDEGTSECGIRNYEPNRSLKTFDTQFAGKKGSTYGNPGITYVEKLVPRTTPWYCMSTCYKTNCTNWTWEMETANGMCALNTFRPTRLINTEVFNPNPNLASGCFLDECKYLTPIPPRRND